MILRRATMEIVDEKMPTSSPSGPEEHRRSPPRRRHWQNLFDVENRYEVAALQFDDGGNQPLIGLTGTVSGAFTRSQSTG